ncbi:MAG: aldehyde dehydrogenase family protein, partial [Alicyclobacillus sp.]|nr:aldehyde dehydrogenase family protein [Alicyclobacillus sp.]
MVGDFLNEPLTDFSREAERKRFQTALNEVHAQLGQSYPLRIGGREIWTEQRLVSINPSQTSQVVGYVAAADRNLAEQAVVSAQQALSAWSRKSFAERARYLW